MAPDSLPEHSEIFQAIEREREQALAKYFQIVRPRLKRIVNFRLDYRLNGRVSESDVIQEAYVRAAKHIDNFLTRRDLPFFVWLRMELHQMLLDIHRHHFDAEKRDVRKDQLFTRTGSGGETSLAIAAHLIGRVSTPSRLVEKAEQIALVQQTLEQLPELDREIIALRHFEELSNLETAEYLGIEPSAASKRYLRALKRLKEIMNMVSGNNGT
jgi:RNA polymerase sigma-70 factor (ECF subfamily)